MCEHVGMLEYFGFRIFSFQAMIDWLDIDAVPLAIVKDFNKIILPIVAMVKLKL